MRPGLVRQRTTVVVLLVALVIGAFIVRLIDIQVVRADALNKASAGKMSISETVYGSRGTITDRNGTVLAAAEMRYNVTASPSQAKNDFDRTVNGKKTVVTTDEAATEIAQLTGQTPNQIIDILNQALAKDPTSDYAILAKSVDLTAFRALNKLDIPWLYFEQAPSRVYPNGAVAGNLVGFVGEEGKPLAGLEVSQNQCVGGTDGQETSDRSAQGGITIPGSTVTTKAGSNGGTLKLTIDSDMQWYVQQVLAKQVQAQRGSWGMAVVMEVKTGKLVAVADYPSIDPNNLNGTSEKFRGSLAFTAPYEPGSTMKPLTLSMLLDQHKVTPTTPVNATYSVTYPNGASFHDSGYHASNLTLTGVLVESSNVGVSRVASSIPSSLRFDYMKKFGLGQTTAVDFLGESSGILHPFQEWDNQSYYTTMFGQAFTATAIQMASGYQALGNKGVRLPVQLVESCTKADGTVITPEKPDGVRVVSEQAARTTVDMMENVATKGWLRKQLAIPGYRVAAKTGTAQQSNGHGSYSHSYIVTLEGLVPAQDPQYVVLTTIADAALNSTAAVAPVFHDICVQVLKQYRVEPYTANAPSFPLNY